MSETEIPEDDDGAWLRDASVRGKAANLEAGRVPGVYAISDGEFFKIGLARVSVEERLRNLQCGNPRPLQLLLIVSLNPEDERKIQAALSRFHVRGEWYRQTHESLAELIIQWEDHGSPEAGPYCSELKS